MADVRIAGIYYDVFARTSQLQVAQNQVLQFGQTTKTTGTGVGALSAAVTQLGTQSAAATAAMASGAQRANTVIRQASDGVTQVQRKMGNASFAIASTLEGVARSGTTSAEAMKNLLRQGANAAFFFGPVGAFVGALGAATLAIVALFKRPREELEALERRNAEFIRQLREARDLPRSAREASRLFSGDPNARIVDDEGKEIAGGRAEQLGVARLRALVAAAKAAVAETQKQLDLEEAKAGTLEFNIQQQTTLVALEQVQTENLKNQEAALLAIEKRYIEALDLTRELTKVAVGEETNEIRKKAAKEAADAAEQALKKEKELTRDLGEAVRVSNRHIAEANKLWDEAFASAGLQRAREFREILASLTPTAVDDLTIALEELQAKLKEQKAPQEFIDRITTIHQTLIQSTGEMEKLTKFLEDVESSGLSAMSQLKRIEEERLLIQTELDLLTDDDERSIVRRKQLLEQLKAIDRARERIAAENTKHLTDAQKDALRLAEIMRDAASAAFGMSSALLGADHSITRMLGGASQLINGFTRIAELSTLAGGLGKLFGTSGGAISALGPLGAIVGGGIALASLVGPAKDPEAEERLRVMKENNLRLAELRDGLDDAVRLSVSGRTAGAVLTTPFRGGPDQRGIARPVSEFLEELARVGVGLTDLRKLAADLGITIKDALPSIDEIDAIREALQLQGLKELFGTLAGQLKFLELQARALGLRDEDVLLRKAKILSEAVPLFAQALGGIDIRTAEGRAEAIARLIKTLEGLKSLTPEQLGLLGDLPIGEFADQLVEFIEALRRLEPEVAEIADATAQAADTAADAAERAAARAAALTRTRQRLAITDLEGDAQAVLEALLAAWTQQIPSLGPLLRQFAGATLDETIRKIFDAVTSGVIAIEELGVPLDEFLAALLEIESASDAAAAALQSVAGVLQAFEQIDIETRLLGGERLSNETLRRKLGTLFPSTGGLDDLTTLQGISDTIALIRHAISVEKDADRKKALESFLADLLDAFDAMRTGGTAGAGAGAATTTRPSGGDVSRTGVTQITERSAFLMIDLDRTRNVILRNIEDLLRSGAGALRPVSLGAVTPPTASLGGSAVSVAQAGGTVVHVHQHFTINVGAGADAEAVGAAVGRGGRQALENIDARLFQNVQGRRRTQGASDLT